VGLLVALTHALTEETAVLYVAYDTEAPPPMSTMAPTRGLLGGALVLAPQPSAHALARLEWRAHACAKPPGGAAPGAARPANAALVAGNALERSIAMFEALADAEPRDIVQNLGAQLTLELHIEPRR
jgi:hypothetical protein